MTTNFLKQQDLTSRTAGAGQPQAGNNGSVAQRREPHPEMHTDLYKATVRRESAKFAAATTNKAAFSSIRCG